MEQFPPIFVISLKNSPRRDIIAQRLNGLKLNFKFIDGINGKTLSQDELNNIDYTFYPQRFAARKPLTVGEIGCAMSHLSIYQMMCNEKIARAIILEDDAIVSHEFEAIVKDSLKKVSKNVEILFYDHGKAKSYCWKKTLVENYRLVHYRKPSKTSKRAIMCATAYLITLSGAQKLLQIAYPIRMPADYLSGALQLTGLKAYGVEPPCVFKGAISEIDAMEQR
ncbi:glycosyltransferase family 25 protein [Pasteurella multocida]|uniref:glycosyltransferase family 25 protein n=1 Tax=Pasteurella multocida TaxID=747 RepID=UPI002A51900E|nr:glycosyltransferase family 25 protein [Pasteurella multocida]MDY0574145.1 glycosyltransferase family 25 protein [Pasteurella multocida]MDY0580775.1 glycosyltransferase family 25 protein [Pasteurella multocida]MDY0582514.1 glycosyltransferase family 25 protein [Pasteurella multocida]MDY0597358.1 glycosyltransferase family 25 protein [Pasteurella multocida]